MTKCSVYLHFSSAFNTIIPQHLIEKLSLLSLNTSFCNWILDFLTGRPHLILIIKFADDTIVVGLISKNDETQVSGITGTVPCQTTGGGAGREATELAEGVFNWVGEGHKKLFTLVNCQQIH
ncbi:hypothetical protein QTP70_016166 [Hemibagrus guttatus]|uniref:Reverse transcriptase domain-containing protein n=1 Tax=Hemibagrus guttatus TaxID=175788 RepID=A0AAE0QFF1_9TELE|nr:hypothetical protein QTP70_016166 [Hemibagrus guttatus]